jgi:hypothetical protein
LNRIISRKAQLETETDSLKLQKRKLSEEVSSLSRVIEKTRQEAEKAKKELFQVRHRETELEEQLAQLKEQLQKKLAPVLVVSKPKDGAVTKFPSANLHIVAVDDNGISDLKVFINNSPLELTGKRGIKHYREQTARKSTKIDVTFKIPLKFGPNEIWVKAKDADELEAQETIQIVRIKDRGKIWATVIGINRYRKIRWLKYAVNDANAFKDYLESNLQLPSDRIFSITDQEATRDNILSTLGTKLRRKVSSEDTVIIFFAGHGAVEADPINPDGDGFEKYLLPYDARLDDLYSTSISMEDVRRIFHRIQSDRLIFIADTCYSGAAGGRTTLTSKTRAAISDNFFDRISRGKGRVIISSCSPNEVSKATYQKKSRKHRGSISILSEKVKLKGSLSSVEFKNSTNCYGAFLLRISRTLFLNYPIVSIFYSYKIPVVVAYQQIRDFHQSPLCKFDDLLSHSHIKIITAYKQLSRLQFNLLFGVQYQRNIVVFN